MSTTDREPLVGDVHGLRDEGLAPRLVGADDGRVGIEQLDGRPRDRTERVGQRHALGERLRDLVEGAQAPRRLAFRLERALALGAEPLRVLVQARVLDGDAELRGERDQQRRLLLARHAAARKRRDEQANRLVSDDERRGDQRPRCRRPSRVAHAREARIGLARPRRRARRGRGAAQARDRAARSRPRRGAGRGRARRRCASSVPRAGRRPRARCRAARRRGRRPSRACARATAPRSPGRRRARSARERSSSRPRPVGAPAGSQGSARAAREHLERPERRPAAARRRRRAAAASRATRRARSVTTLGRRPLDHDQPPVAGLRPLGRVPLDRVAAASGRRHRDRRRTVVAQLPERARAELRRPGSRAARSRARRARPRRHRRARRRPASSASPPRRSSGSAAARQPASTAIWLAASFASVRSAWEKAPAVRSSSTTPSRSPPASTGTASTLPGARARGNAAQPCRRRVERGELAASSRSIATRCPRARPQAPARRTPRRGRRAGRKQRSASRSTTVSAPVPAASASASAASRSSRPAGPERRPLGPFWIDHCTGVLPLSDAFRRRPS